MLVVTWPYVVSVVAADVPLLDSRAAAVEFKFAALHAETARQREQLEQLLAAHEAVIALVSEKLSRFQVAAGL